MLLFRKFSLVAVVVLLPVILVGYSLWLEFGQYDAARTALPGLIDIQKDAPAPDGTELAQAGRDLAFHPLLAFQSLSPAFRRDCAARPLASPLPAANAVSSSDAHPSTQPRQSPRRDSLQLFKRQVARDLAYWYAKGSITARDLLGISSFARVVQFRGGRFVSNHSAYGYDPGYKLPAYFSGLESLLPKKPFTFLLSEKDEPISIPADVPSVRYASTRDLLRHSSCARANFGDISMTGAASELAVFKARNQSIADLHGFFINPASFVATNTRTPVFSQCKTACYFDLLYPSKFHFDERKYGDGRRKKKRGSHSFESVGESDDANLALRGDALPPLDRDEIPWERKANALFWRGSISGGYNSQSNHKRMHRIRLLEWARLYDLRHPNRTFTHTNATDFSAFQTPDYPMIDVGTFKLLQADLSVQTELINTYGVKPKVPFKEVFRYKYVLVVDGNTWPSRLRRWVDTNSVIFYSGIFHDWWTAHLEPWQHYIPVKLDYSDLEEKLLWAYNHDSEARAIMERARDLMRYFNRREHLDCYLRLLLEEYQNLWKDE